tara:strand:+ start:2564 stop:2974 length:411 start_codon:yes stop_codon:yes gene_type:complete
MAFEVKKINPLDLQPRKAIGIKLPFSGNAVFNSTFTSKEAVKTNLINFLLTGKGERVFNPEFGSGLRELLFENINEDSINTIKLVIEEGLDLFFPNLILNEFNLNSNPDSNSVNLYLNYSIDSTNIDDEVVINIAQ